MHATFSETKAHTDDAELIERIITAYRNAASTFGGHGRSMWGQIGSRSDRFHRKLINGDFAAVAMQLRNPATHDLLYGFDDTNRTHRTIHEARTEEDRTNYARSIRNNIIRLAEAVSAVRLRNPEAPRALRADASLDSTLDALDQMLGFKVDFPNPYPGEFGLDSSRGVIQFRAVGAIYQAWRLFQIAGKAGRVLEIGAGAGRVAYYSRKLGVTDYTIVDIPLTNVAQANFLGRTLDPSILVLSHECDNADLRDKIRIMTPHWLANSDDRFDVALNADSMTEMDYGQAFTYFQMLAERAKVFLSINHEINSFRVFDLLQASGITPNYSRHPYWMRDGYVEEVFEFTGLPSVDRDITHDFTRRAATIENQQKVIDEQRAILRSRKALLFRFLRLMAGQVLPLD